MTVSATDENKTTNAVTLSGDVSTKLSITGLTKSKNYAVNILASNDAVLYALKFISGSSKPSLAGGHIYEKIYIGKGSNTFTPSTASNQLKITKGGSAAVYNTDYTMSYELTSGSSIDINRTDGTATSKNTLGESTVTATVTPADAISDIYSGFTFPFTYVVTDRKSDNTGVGGLTALDKAWTWTPEDVANGRYYQDYHAGDGVNDYIFVKSSETSNSGVRAKSQSNSQIAFKLGAKMDVTISSNKASDRHLVISTAEDASNVVQSGNDNVESHTFTLEAGTYYIGAKKTNDDVTQLYVKSIQFAPHVDKLSADFTYGYTSWTSPEIDEMTITIPAHKAGQDFNVTVDPGTYSLGTITNGSKNGNTVTITAPTSGSKTVTIPVTDGVTTTDYQIVVTTETATGTAFNENTRYSKLLIEARKNDFYSNTNSGGLDYGSNLDYVPGLVAKAMIDAVDYYKDHQNSDITNDLLASWYNSVKTYGSKNISDNGKAGKSFDDLNATKIYFGMKNVAASGKVTGIEAYGDANEKLGLALIGIKKANTSYSISSSHATYPISTADMQGGWWHKADYINQMWGDGQYMGTALLAQLINDADVYDANIESKRVTANDWDVVAKQIKIYHKYAWDSSANLPHHAIAADKGTNNASHSNTWKMDGDETYRNQGIWGRAAGWYFMALVDVLEQMPTSHADYNTIKGYLSAVASGLRARQDATTGCWYQLPLYDHTFSAKEYARSGNDNTRVYNYLESSATALYTAAYFKAIRLGLLDKAIYEATAKKAYQGIIENFMSSDNNLYWCCKSAGLGGKHSDSDCKFEETKERFRDGSNAYYLKGYDVAPTKPGSYTEGKALGAFIMAATEYERAYLEEPGFNVTFVSGSEGTAPADAENVTTVPDVTPSSIKSGYTFNGWYKNDGTKVNAGDAVAKDITLYAGYTYTGTQSFSLTVKSGQTISNAASGSNTDLTSTYATISGGSALVHNGSGSAQTMLNNGAVNLGGSGGSYLKMTLSKALAEGDFITITTPGVYKLTKGDSNSNAETTSGGVYTVAAGDKLIGGSDLYVWKAGVQNQENDAYQISNVTVKTSTPLAPVAEGASTTVATPVAYGDRVTVNVPVGATKYYAKWDGSPSLTIDQVAVEGNKRDVPHGNSETFGTELTPGTHYLYMVAEVNGVKGALVKYEYTVAAPILYTVTFDANEGTCGTTELTEATQGAGVTLPDATRAGYIFNGWYTAATAGEKVGNAGATYNPTADITLYAQWRERGSVGSDVLYSYEVNTAEAAQLTQYTALGTPGGTAQYGVGNKIEEGKGFKSDNGMNSKKYMQATLAGDETLKAGDVIKITAYCTSHGGGIYIANATGVNGADGSNGTTANYVNAGNAVRNQATELTYTVQAGDLLVGQSTIYLFRNGTTATTGTSTYIQKVEIQRPTEQTEYTVTLDAQVHGKVEGATAITGSTVVLPKVVPTEGYTFLGWATTSGATVPAYYAKAQYKPTKNETLYAVYSQFGQPNNNVGSANTPFWAAFSPFYKLEANKAITFTFTNNGGSNQIWENWLMVVTNNKNYHAEDPNAGANNEHFVLRPDGESWGDQNGKSSSKLYKLNTATNKYELQNTATEDFKSRYIADMADADVTLRVSHDGSKIYTYAETTSKSGSKYLLTNVSGAITATAFLSFTTEYSKITNLTNVGADAYTVTVVNGDATNGDAEIQTANGATLTTSTFAVPAGTKVNYVAAPKDKYAYKFTGWTGSASSANATYAVTVDANKSLTANFVALVKPAQATFTPTGSTLIVGAPITATWTNGATLYTVWDAASDKNYTIDEMKDYWLTVKHGTSGSANVVSERVGTWYLYSIVENAEGVPSVTKVDTYTFTEPTDATFRITTQPQSKSVIPNEHTVLSVEVDGAPTSYQWYTGTVGSGEAIPGATSATYEPVTTDLGTTTYYCVVTKDYQTEDGTAQSDSRTSDAVTVNVSNKIGADGNTSLNRGEIKGYTTLTPGSSVNYKFVNTTEGSQTWYNWFLRICNEDGSEALVLRPDKWEEKKNSALGYTLTPDYSSPNWDTFKSEMNGASVDITVNYSADNKITMTATMITKTGQTWTCKYSSATAGMTLSGNLTTSLTIDHSQLTMKSLSSDLKAQEAVQVGTTTGAVEIPYTTSSNGEIVTPVVTDNGNATVSVDPANKKLTITGVSEGTTKVTLHQLADDTHLAGIQEITVTVANTFVYDATLASISYNGIDIPLTADVYTYTAKSPSHVVPTVVATPTQAVANVVITQPTAVDGTATIVVTSGPTETQTYTINFSASAETPTSNVTWNFTGGNQTGDNGNKDEYAEDNAGNIYQLIHSGKGSSDYYGNALYFNGATDNSDRFISFTGISGEGKIQVVTNNQKGTVANTMTVYKSNGDVVATFPLENNATTSSKLLPALDPNETYYLGVNGKIGINSITYMPKRSDVLYVTENKQEYKLTKENHDADAFFTSASPNWSTGDGIAVDGGKYHLATLKTNRSLTLKVDGAQAFEIYTQNGGGSERAYKLTYAGNPEGNVSAPKGYSTSGIIATGNSGEITIKLEGTSDQVYPYKVIFYTEKPIATLEPKEATVKVGHSVNVDLTAVNDGAITMDELTDEANEIVGATYNAGVLRLSGKKAGTATLTFNIAENPDNKIYQGGTAELKVTVEKQNLKLTFSPAKYEWNKLTTPNKPAFSSPSLQVAAENEDGTFRELTGAERDAVMALVTYASDDLSLVSVTNTGEVDLVSDDKQGYASVYAQYAGDETYNATQAEFVVEIIQGVKRMIGSGDTDTKIGDIMTLYDVDEDGNTDDTKPLVVATFGGWNHGDHKYSYPDPNDPSKTSSTAKADGWENAKRQDGMAPIDGYEYAISGINNAMDETKSPSDDVIYGTKRPGWYRIPKDANTAYPYSLPVRGSVMTFEPTCNGTLTIYILQNGAWNTYNNGDKYNTGDPLDPKDGSTAKTGEIKYSEFRPHSFYVVDMDGVPVPYYTDFTVTTKQKITDYYKCILPGHPGYDPDDIKNIANWTEFNTYMSIGEQQRVEAAWTGGTLGAQNIVQLDNGSFLAVQKGIVKYTFYVAAGQTYYMFSNFSKLGFSGMNFVKDEDYQPTGTLELTQNAKSKPVYKAATGKVSVPQYETITVDRTFTPGQWSTICLPFSMMEKEVVENFGEGTQLVIYDGLEEKDGKDVMHFVYHELQHIVAGYPYLIKPTGTGVTLDGSGKINGITVHNKLVEPEKQQTSFTTSRYYVGSPYVDEDGDGLYKFRGTEDYLSETYYKGDIYMSISAETPLKRLTSASSTMKGYRAFFECNDPGAALAKPITLSFGNFEGEEEDTPTDIMEVVEELGLGDRVVIPTNGIYNLNGQKMSDNILALPKGVYIVDGKKMNIK
ncbi:MAG: glycoside hydrolase family 88 protein [Prevotella sp.]|nr:glycoside hydrolase family 88 protein [Candidatus Prevotella equi]